MPDLFELISLLKRSQIFSEVATEDLREVAQALEEEHFFSGDRVFEIDQQGERMYILYSGRIGISTHSDPAARSFVKVLGPGESFGEMNLLDELPRSATAHVLEDADVLSLEKEKLRGLILDFPELSLGILRSMSLRLRESNLRQRDNES